MNRSSHLAALAAMIAAIATTASISHAQQPPAIDAPLTFAVSVIKPADPAARGSNTHFLPGAGLQVTNDSLKRLIMFAYEVQDFQVSGPAWIESTRYDITAKPDGAQGPGSLTGVADKDREALMRQMRERLRSLLADRFQLTIHKETKELPVYALVLAKGGSKLTESIAADGSGQSTNLHGNNAKNVLTGTRVPMSSLAKILAGNLGRPVLDQTGLNARYDLKLEWAQDLRGGGPDAVEKTDTDMGPSIFTAIQQQLGLKLESQKGPVEVIVIDRVEKPSDN